LLIFIVEKKRRKQLMLVSCIVSVTSWRCYILLPTDNDLISSMPMEEQEARDKDRQSKEEGLDHIAARTSAKDVRNTESERREKEMYKGN
jgi:hypothetical protein